MKFSIIIPVRRINDFLKENITYLKKLTYSDFEVIIIVDRMEAYDFRGDSRFTIIESGPVGPGIKRNLGANKAKGDVLAFLDDDACPSENWLTEAAKILEDTSIYALGGPALTPINAGFLEKAGGKVLESRLASGNTRYRHIPLKAIPIADYPSVNLFVRKNAFDAVGGFCSEYWPGEDTKLCLDLVQYNKKPFLYSPFPQVYHHRRNLFIPHLKQVSRYGQHRGLFARIFPETSRLPSYFIPSLLVMYLIAAPVLSTIWPDYAFLFLFGIFIYMLLLMIEAGRVALQEKSVVLGIYVGVGIFLTHMIYGVYIIIGLLNKPKLKLKSVDATTGNYSEG